MISSLRAKSTNLHHGDTEENQKQHQKLSAEGTEENRGHGETRLNENSSRKIARKKQGIYG
jgi:hypothetical protein